MRACMHAAGVTSCCCCRRLPVLAIPSSGFVRACMWGANALQEGRTHAPFGAGRCSSQGARLALFSTRIQGGGASALCPLPCRRRWARARASTLACMGVSPKGNVFWHRAAQQPQHSIYRPYDVGWGGGGGEGTPVVGRSMPFLHHPPARLYWLLAQKRSVKVHA